MKIKSIRFLNLNSLRGEHEIRFDEPPLSDSGLFAITGPTGAGKTTILDAITLGLYGCVNRHTTDLAAQIMTRHTGEAFSEVTFEARNEIYRAKWQVYRSRKKPDGKLQQPTMELCKVADGIPLDLKNREVAGKVAELCGLDYSQFLRSVMLSQGEFTRFLKASDSERSELLERITDTGIYTDISREAFLRAKTEKTTLQLLRSELSGQTLLSPEMLAEQEAALETFKEKEAELKQNRTATETQLAWLKNLEKLAAKKQETQNSLAELQTNAARYEADFARLEHHKVALNFRPDLVKLEREQQLFSDLQTQQNQIQARLPELKHTLQEAKQKAEETKTLQFQAEKVLQEIAPLLDKVLQKDSEIESLRRQFLKNKETYNLAKAAFEKDAAEADNYRKTVADLTQKLAGLQSWLLVHAPEKELASELNIFERYLKDLEEIIQEGKKWKKEKETATETIDSAKGQTLNSEQKLTGLTAEQTNLLSEITSNTVAIQEALAGTTEVELEAILDTVPVRLHQLERLQQMSVQLQQLATKEQLLTAQKTTETTRLESLQTARTELDKRLEDARYLHKNFQEMLEFQLQVQNYEEARNNLKPGCECPLCGSLEHPFATGLESKLKEATEKRNMQQKVVAELEKNSAEKQTELATLKANVQTTASALTENLQEKTILEKAFSEINAQLENAFSATDTAFISEVILADQQQLTTKKQQLEKVRKLKQQAQTFTEKHYRLQTEILSLTSAKEQAQDRRKNAEVTLQNAEKELLDLQEQYGQILTEASSFTLRFSLTFSVEKGSILLQELRQLAHTFAAQTESLQRTQLQATEAEGNRQKFEARQTEKQKHLDELQVTLKKEHEELSTLKTEREHLFGQKDPVEERTRLTRDSEQKKQVAEVAQQTWQQFSEKLNLAEAALQKLAKDAAVAEANVQQLQTELERKLTQQNIASVANLKARFLPETQATELSVLQLDFEKMRTEQKQTLADTTSELQTEEARKLTTETVAILTQKLLQTELEISEANQQIGSISQILKKEKELQEKHRELAARIASQQKEAERWERLSELIGSNDGKKFSKFAQGLTLAKLVTLANRHLAKLNDRYQLQKAPNSDLELQMIDTYQADAVRSVNTLSGGESFLVSLALALGLSDLASHKTQIDSLFIDEGFGTLDAETLDVAVTALENLQAGGKMIGIISHVEALKERISTQIQVKKMSGGVSKIEISAYNYETVFA